MTTTTSDGDDDDQQQQDESITALFEIISTTSALTTTATDDNQNATPFTILQVTTSTTDDTTPISSLYEQWLALQGTTATTPTKPIQQTQASNELGSMNKVNSGYDPNCKNTTSTTTTCPAGQDPFATPGGGGLFPDKAPKKSSGRVGIIVGVIVGVLVVVIILFIAVICGVRHCRTNQTCCFAPVKKSKDHDQSHLELMDGDSDASSPRATSRALTSKSGVELSATNGSKKTKTKSAKESVTTELSLVEDEESQELPQGWQKMKHITTGEVFYVNDSEMLSQRHKPGTAECADMGW